MYFCCNMWGNTDHHNDGDRYGLSSPSLHCTDVPSIPDPHCAVDKLNSGIHACFHTSVLPTTIHHKRAFPKMAQGNTHFEDSKHAFTKNTENQ